MADSARFRRNYSKHTNPNPLQQWLLRRFHACVAEMASQVLGGRHSAAPLSSAPPRYVLDVGCGEGFVATYLQCRLPGLQLVGVDADYRTVGSVCRGGRFLGGDARALPFANGAFDLVLCLEVLEHLAEPAAAVGELVRVSRGPVVVSVPHHPYFSLANLARGKNLARGGDDPEHRHRWRPRQFAALLDERGAVERMAYAFPWMIALVRPGVS